MAAVYDRSFGRLCAGAAPAMVRGLSDVTPARVLDAGTGTGTLAAALADAGHRVTAVDAEPTMIELAAARRPDVTFVHAALPDLPFADDAFDAAVAGFVVNHVERPRRAVRELARVVRPRGTVRVSIWPGAPASPLSLLWAAVVERSGARPPAGTRLPPEDDFARDAEGLAGLLTGAGLDGATVRKVSWTFSIAPADLWAGVEAGLATIGQTYRAQDAATRRAMRAAYDALTADRPGGLLALPSTALVASGSVPG